MMMTELALTVIVVLRMGAIWMKTEAFNKILEVISKKENCHPGK
jgi:hypothetical protein